MQHDGNEGCFQIFTSALGLVMLDRFSAPLSIWTKIERLYLFEVCSSFTFRLRHLHCRFFDLPRAADESVDSRPCIH